MSLDGVIHSLPAPARHHDILNTHKTLAMGQQGFLTNEGRFVTRMEARCIAEQAGQMMRRVGGDDSRLFSENLW